MVHCWDRTTTWAAMPLNQDLGASGLALECNDAATLQVIDIAAIEDLASAEFTGKTCPQEQVDHETITGIIAAIEAGNVGSQLASSILTYQNFVANIAFNAQNECIAALTAADIDTGTPGLQSCTPQSASMVCAAYIRHPIVATLGDLTGVNFTPPSEAGLGTKVIEEGEVCDFMPDFLGGPTSGTDGGSDSDGDGGTTGTPGDGADDESSSDDGSSTGGGLIDPFGDLDDLVFCDATGVSCVFQEALVTNIKQNFTVFYTDGVALTLLKPADRGYPGAMLSGLDAGEASDDLARTFGLDNGDVIKSVNGIPLVDEDDALTAIDALISSEALVMSLYREGEPIDYRIVLRE